MKIEEERRFANILHWNVKYIFLDTLSEELPSAAGILSKLLGHLLVRPTRLRQRQSQLEGDWKSRRKKKQWKSRPNAGTRSRRSLSGAEEMKAGNPFHLSWANAPCERALDVIFQRLRASVCAPLRGDSSFSARADGNCFGMEGVLLPETGSSNAVRASAPGAGGTV